MTRSFFIFTMAISVIHNPSDNKLCGLLQVFARRFTQCGALGFRSTANFSRFFSSMGTVLDVRTA